VIEVEDKRDYEFIVRSIKNVLDFYEIESQNVILMLSDAASYMKKARKFLKIEYKNLFHVTCFAHLFYNCSMIVKEAMENVDRLISSVKAAVVKNKSRRDLFAALKAPPTPAPTRWGTWLEAVEYYCENLPAVKKIFQEESSAGIIMGNVKRALKILSRDLAKIQ